jgi:hypothetical protein
MNLKKKHTYIIFWLPVGTCHRNLAIKKNLKFDELDPFNENELPIALVLNNMMTFNHNFNFHTKKRLQNDKHVWCSKINLRTIFGFGVSLPKFA